jgi:hypothetical protein
MDEMLAHVCRVVQSKAAACAHRGESFQSGAYARAVARNKAIELGEKARAERGAPARSRAMNGKNKRVLDTLHDPWLRELLVYMRGYVGSVGLSSEWPIEAWIADKNRFDGGDRPISNAARHELAGDIERVLEVATSVAGTAWVVRTLLEPLARRSSQVRRGAGTQGSDRRDDEISDADTSRPRDEMAEICGRLFISAYRRGKSREEAAREAVTATYGSRDATGQPLAALNSKAAMRKLVLALEDYSAVVDTELAS